MVIICWFIRFLFMLGRIRIAADARCGVIALLLDGSIRLCTGLQLSADLIGLFPGALSFLLVHHILLF
ncbi:MAG TPA: hypothetical protein VGM63_22090 [Mucilaginibacter sp.]|jgi:hypothetical protein